MLPFNLTFLEVVVAKILKYFFLTISIKNVWSSVHCFLNRFDQLNIKTHIFPDRSVHRMSLCSFVDTRGTVDQLRVSKFDSVEIIRKLQIIPIKKVSAGQNRRRRHYKMVATGG
jgi:hypothetical protein